jgi:glyoxylase-like metal-dependent hydrolase (beta-lactamase superfamily II)
MNQLLRLLSDEFEHILFAEGERGGKYPYSNSLLVGRCLIDTGIGQKRISALKNIKPIDKVLFSHWHEDHISGNRHFSNVVRYSHKNDRDVIENVHKIKSFYGIQSKDMERLLGKSFSSSQLMNVKIEETLEDGQDIPVGKDLVLKVIYTPGHSRGHCCFIETKSKIAFLADIDLTSFGPWYGGVDSNCLEFENSIRKLLNLDIAIAISSHKGIFRGKGLILKKLNRYMSVIHQRDQLILSFLSHEIPKTAEDLANRNIIYKYYTVSKEYEMLSEKIMIQHHFDKLLKTGQIEAIRGGYILATN